MLIRGRRVGFPRRGVVFLLIHRGRRSFRDHARPPGSPTRATSFESTIDSFDPGRASCFRETLSFDAAGPMTNNFRDLTDLPPTEIDSPLWLSIK